MIKWLLSLLVLIQLIITISNNIDDSTFDPSLSLILFNNTCIYTENESGIYEIDIEGNSKPKLLFNVSNKNYKNKTLIKISNEEFIIFALNNENKICYNTIKMTENKPGEKQLSTLELPIIGGIGNHTIKYINENTYLLYYFYSSSFYLYTLHLDSYSYLNPGGIKTIETEGDYVLNTIECDSYDGEYIFCVYSTIEIANKYNAYSTMVYYSFENINVRNIKNNKIKDDISGPALLKMENAKKQFLICYYEFYTSNEVKNNPSVYCQLFSQNGNKIIIEQIYSIGATRFSQLSYELFPFQSVVLLTKYKYTIYIHLKLKQNGDNPFASEIIIASIDLKFIIPYYLSSPVKKDILVNDKYLLFLINSGSNIKVETVNFLQCPNTTSFDLTNKFDGENLTEFSKVGKINNNMYLSFHLDPLTYIYVNNTRNMGTTLYKIDLKQNPVISLKYNENLKITYNYYIYHGEDVNSGDQKELPCYTIYSNFCLLKVFKCYESCKTCNEDVIGTDDLNQCSKCKNGSYFEFPNSLDETGFFNCYMKDNKNVENYFLDDNNQYKKCHESCKTCSNSKSCIKCNEGYYFKEDTELNDYCYKNTLQGYYLDIKGETIMYKKCYKTCDTCFDWGNETYNNCTSCKNEYKSYPYDNYKCTEKIEECDNNWKINKTNNLECVDDCGEDYIIRDGTNKNQCVQDCQSYINPLGLSYPLLFYTCDTQKYCITKDFAKLKNLDCDSTTCHNKLDECFDMDDTTQITDPTEVEKFKPQPEKNTFVKYFNFKTNYSEFDNFSEEQIEIYISELNLELNSYEYKNIIDLITVNTYEDFIITIYPLRQEEYLYSNVIKLNNLCFTNFREIIDEKKYQKQNDSIILIALIEFKNINIPINSINYFFFEYKGEENNNQHIQIPKSNITNDFSLKIKTEYPIHDYNNPNISEQYSSNLISTIKDLNTLNPDFNFVDTKDEFYSDICITFTSEEDTDMTVYDRTESKYSKISLCENGCQFIKLIDKGKNENPRAECECEIKKYPGKSNDNYTFIYEKIEGQNVSNFKVLTCAKSVFDSKEIGNNFIFWIFLFLIFIIFIIFLDVIFCGKNSVENILKVKKEVEESEENQKSENMYSPSEKMSSGNSEANFQSIEIRDKYNSKYKENISSKISYAVPPKKKKELIPSKEDKRSSKKTEENNSINTTINYYNKLKIKNPDDMFDEIFPDYNEVLNNNFYENKYMQNNYINLRMKNLKLKKYFLAPIEKEYAVKHNNTDTEDNTDEFDSYKYLQKRKTMFNYYQTLLPKAEVSMKNLRKHYKGKECMSEYDINNNKKINKKQSIKIFEEKNFFGDEQIFQDDEDKNITIKKKRKTKIKNKNINDLEENEDKDNIFIHKKKKSILSSNNSNDKKSDSSSIRSLKKLNSLDKYFLNSSNNNITANFKYNFCSFYWIYLNKREFCLVSLYNLQDNIVSFIRIPTFIFVISLLFTINCLFLTANQIHERYIYKKQKGSKNEFTYIFQNEIGLVFFITLIYIIIKILFIKLIYGKLFRISYTAKEDLSPFGLDSEKDDKNIKRKAYLKIYQKKALIYIVILLVLMIILGYISICYFGIFKNTKASIIIRFFIAFIFSIIICAILCLIIVTIYHFGRKKKNKCMKIAYKIFAFIY